MYWKRLLSTQPWTEWELVEEISTPVTSGMAVAEKFPGLIDVLARGPNGELRHAEFDGESLPDCLNLGGNVSGAPGLDLILRPRPTSTHSVTASSASDSLLASWNEIALEPWLPKLVGLEEQERKRRSLERRLRAARIGTFKSIADYDWAWPERVVREAIDDLLSLKFVEEGINAVLLGPNGVGKTLILRNIAHQAALRGHTIRFTTASDMLSDLAAAVVRRPCSSLAPLRPAATALHR